jgi:Family of unknown function (DUF6069)
VSAPAPVTVAGSGSGSLLRSTVLIGLASAALVTVLAAVLHGAGVSFEIDGEMIPLDGFALLTFMGAVVGGLLLAALNHWSNAVPRRFLLATAALTALSCIPSLALPDDTGTKVALVALHLLAASVIVPVLLRHADA